MKLQSYCTCKLTFFQYLQKLRELNKKSEDNRDTLWDDWRLLLTINGPTILAIIGMEKKYGGDY